MSYSRFGFDSDVYVFLNTHGYLDCCGCVLQERKWVEDASYKFFGGYFINTGETVETRFKTIEALFAHLEKHKEAGHLVPEELYESLNNPEEIAIVNEYINNHQKISDP